jgi:hypothetical protein
VQMAFEATTGDKITSTAIGAGASVVTEEFMTRKMSRRERFRVGTVLNAARSRYGARYTRGDDLREDDFVAGDPSFFDESVEGALIAAQRQHEEKKLGHIGCLIANLPFEATIDRVTANWCIRIAEELSWNQYILLALNGEDESAALRARVSAGPGEFRNHQQWSTWQNFISLQTLGLVDSVNRVTGRVPAVGELPPRMLWIPTTGGRLLIELLCLETISSVARDEVYAALAGGAAAV